jgi:hypothetical protein
MKKIFCFLICLLFIGSLPTAMELEIMDPVGYGVGKIYGVLPRMSGNIITCFLIGPLLGYVTLDLTRSSRQIRILFIIREYLWITNGPPVYNYLWSETI